ncbi:MAG TPA: helix-turn-helix transcriptional regulator, partial [Jatrophihabitantaceae bacterium]|nr:helix-turn-helix transcriptional regulator [Jatrophihabitantaceae bacterium]
GHMVDASIAMHTVMCGQFAEAAELADACWAAATRLRLDHVAMDSQLTRAVLAAHRGRRRELSEATAEFHRLRAEESPESPLLLGLAGAFCALLEEDRALAQAELDRAMSSMTSGSSVYHLSGRHGLNVLLGVLSGRAGWSDYETTTIDPASVLRWDRQFTLFAHAVLLGRSGDPGKAAAATAEALTAGEPYAMSRHLGLRLISEAALADGWGDPATWLRSAESFFHGRDIPAVAGACRALLRKAGVRVPQHRSGADGIPADLRSTGVTVREHEILVLLVGRLGNQEIADRLHLSPRTVERHVGSLMAKTGLPNRIALSQFAANMVAKRTPG